MSLREPWSGSADGALLGLLRQRGPNARRMWGEFPLLRRRRMQKVLSLEGLARDREVSNPATYLFFRDLECSESEEYELVGLNTPSWNQIQVWMREINQLRQALAV